MKSFLSRIIDRLSEGNTVDTYKNMSNQSIHLRMNIPDARRLILQEAVEAEFAKELEEIDRFTVEKRQFQLDKELHQKEFEQKEKKLQLEYADTKATLELAIKAEANSELLELKKSVLENALLKERIKQLEADLAREAKRTDQYSESMAETLKNAFKNQPQVTITK